MGNKHGKLKEINLDEIARISGMDSEEVRNKFDEFVQAYPSGKVNKKNFKTLMSTALPRLKDELEKLGNHIFRVYDSNNDGYIDFVEFMVAYHVMTEGSVEDILGKLFKLFDEDGDGYISIKEMRHLVKDLHELIVIDESDPVTPTGIALGLVGEMDKDSDGKISKDEFISASLAQDTFLSKIVTFPVIDIFTDIYSMKNPLIAITEGEKSSKPVLADTDSIQDGIIEIKLQHDFSSARSPTELQSEDDIFGSLEDGIFEERRSSGKLSIGSGLFPTVVEEKGGCSPIWDGTTDDGCGTSSLIEETSNDSGLAKEILNEFLEIYSKVESAEDNISSSTEDSTIEPKYLLTQLMGIPSEQQLTDTTDLLNTKFEDVYIEHEDHVYSTPEEHIYSSPDEERYIASKEHIYNTIDEINSSELTQEESTIELGHMDSVTETKKCSLIHNGTNSTRNSTRESKSTADPEIVDTNTKDKVIYGELIKKRPLLVQPQLIEDMIEKDFIARTPNEFEQIFEKSVIVRDELRRKSLPPRPKHFPTSNKKGRKVGRLNGNSTMEFWIEKNRVDGKLNGSSVMEFWKEKKLER